MEIKIVKVDSSLNSRRVKSQIFNLIVQVFLNYPGRDPWACVFMGLLATMGDALHCRLSPREGWFALIQNALAIVEMRCAFLTFSSFGHIE